MKSVLIALAVVLVACSTASAGWTYVVPTPVMAPAGVVVYGYGPAYVYPAPTVVTYARPVVPSYVVAYPPAPVYPAPVVVGRPVIVHPKVYVPGQPVRNVLRAVTP